MRVLHVQYTDPAVYPPLVRGAQLLAESGAQVVMLGVQVAGLDALRGPDASGVSVRLMACAGQGWRLKAHYARYAAWVAREGATWRPDWIYASDLLSAPITLMLAAMTGASVVYHEHDAPSLGHDSWTIRRCLAARRRLVRQAAIVVAPNADRAERLSREVGGGRPVYTVWNCPRKPSRAPFGRVPDPSVMGDAAGEDVALRVIYRGSINAERFPPTILEALGRSAAPIGLDIVGYETVGSRGYVAELMRRAKDLGLARRVRWWGTLTEAAVDPLCARSDVGLALMPMRSADENMRHMIGASNKVFEYFGYGVTPLVSDLPDWRDMLVKPGYALACDPDDVESLRRALEWAIDHPQERRAMAERGMARLHDDWNYEAQFAPVLRAMHARRSATVRPLGTEVQCAS